MKLISKMAASAAALMVATVSVIADDEKLFDGPYLAVETGVTDGGEIYVGAAAGYRTQLDNDFVLGAEGTFGDYMVREQVTVGTSSYIARIDYSWSLAGYVGYVFGAGKNNLVKLGAGYNNIHATAESSDFKVGETVDDLRAFVGYERALGDGWNIRFELDYLEVEGSEGGQATGGLSYQF